MATAAEIATAFQSAIKKSHTPQLATFRQTFDHSIDAEKIIDLLDSFEHQCSDLNISDADEKKRLLLLRQPVLSDINCNVPDPSGVGLDSYKKLKQKLLSYFYCQDLKAISKRKLSLMRQKKNESFNDFVKNVRQTAKLAEVDDKDTLRDSIIRGMKDDAIGVKIKRDHFISEKTLDTLIKDTNNLVFATKQVEVLKNETEEVKRVKKTGFRRPGPGPPGKGPNRSGPPRQPSDKCLFCGGRRHKNRTDCPAFGKDCRNCGKKNHFANVCLSRKPPTDKREPFKKKPIYKTRKVQEETNREVIDSEEEDDEIVGSMVNHMTIQ